VLKRFEPDDNDVADRTLLTSGDRP